VKITLKYILEKLGFTWLKMYSITGFYVDGDVASGSIIMNFCSNLILFMLKCSAETHYFAAGGCLLVS
jgi:hypothetical protein